MLMKSSSLSMVYIASFLPIWLDHSESDWILWFCSDFIQELFAWQQGRIQALEK